MPMPPVIQAPFPIPAQRPGMQDDINRATPQRQGAVPPPAPPAGTSRTLQDILTGTPQAR